ncbi:MobQ family relaxase [Carnobacteriaceae bacterium 52-44]
MAIYHFNSKMISRGKGQSVIASAAYRSGEKLYSERYGKTSFYPREIQPESFILKPNRAPEWTLDREKLWNGVEEVEKPMNAQLAREINIALPIELNDEEQRKLTEEYVQKNFVDEGMVADISIHRDDKNNPHFHVMLTTRPFKENGEWGSKSKRIILKDEEGNELYYPSGDKKSRKQNTTDWNTKERFQIWRNSWAEMANKYLEKKGLTERISAKSYAEQGVQKKPTIHEGVVARQIEKKGRKSDRVEKNRQINRENYSNQKGKKENVLQATAEKVIAPLTYEEKRELKEIAKELKVYVNYDNLIKKERMLQNWKISDQADNVTKNSNDDTSENIKTTEEAINRGKEILKDEGIRTFEKYYPKLAERKFSDYQKMSVGLKTIEKKRVLNNDEIKDIFNDIQVKEYAEIFKSVSSSKDIKPLSSYAHNFMNSSKRLDDFYERNNVSIDDISSLNEDKQREFKELFKQKNRDYLIYNTLNNYHEENILAHYPTADINDLKANHKEALSKVISYYGDSLSYDKLAELADQEIVNKYSYTEQKYGLDLLIKLEEGNLTKEDRTDISSDYRKQEILDTVSNEVTRDLFIYEVKNNALLDDTSFNQFDKSYKHSENLFSNLAKNINIFEDLMYAQRDNLMRENEERKHRRKVKQQRKKQKSKQTNQKRGL